MADIDIQAFKKKLLALMAELQAIEQTSNDAARPVELDQASVGRLSRMDAMQGQQMAREAGRRRQAQMVRIQGALTRIETEEFGDCFVCGEPIDLRRLTSDPTITRCVACAEAQDA